MQHPLLSAAAIAGALAFGVTGVFAFTTVTPTTSQDTKTNARLADPDDLMSDMANQQSSGGTRVMHFGSTTLELSGGLGGGGGGHSPFLTNPAAQSVPSLQGR